MPRCQSPSASGSIGRGRRGMRGSIHHNPGTLAVIAAPDGCGKTTYAECIAEHWAHRGASGLCASGLHHRHERIPPLCRRRPDVQARAARSTAEQLAAVQAANVLGVMARITYVHVLACTVQRTMGVLMRMEGGKREAADHPSTWKYRGQYGQLKLREDFQRQADNVEQFKDSATSGCWLSCCRS